MPDRAPPQGHERELSIEHLTEDLGGRAVRGGAIMFAAQIAKVIAQFGSVIVLARLLAPAEFGLIAMVAALNMVLDLIKELGLSAATIQRPHITQAQVSTLFWINASSGALIAVALFMAAPFIAAFYGQPALVPIARWLSLGYLLSGLTIQHWALLRRQMRFSAVALMDSGGEILGFAVAISLALTGVGHWALVAQRLTAPVLSFIGSWSLCRWRPSLPSRHADIRSMVAFGLSVTGCNLMTVLARSVDQILIGWLWGPSILGFYERASKLLLVPINNLNVPLYAVAMPTLSRLADQEVRYRRAFQEVTEKLAMATMPGAALIVMIPDWVTRVLFGPQWAHISPLVACFGLAAVYQPVILVVGLLYLPQNRPRELLRAAMVDAALSILSFVAGLPFGAFGVALSYAITGLVIRLPVAFWLGTLRGPIRLRDLTASIAPSMLAAVVVAATVWMLRALMLTPAHAGTVTGLAICVPAAIMAALATFAALPQSRGTIAAIARIPRLGFRLAFRNAD